MPQLRCVAALLMVELATGCGDTSSEPVDAAAADATASVREDGGRDSGRFEEIPVGRIVVTVAYEGDEADRLYVAAFTEDPPFRAPLALQRINAPEFPTMVELRGLEANDYFVFGVVDRLPPSPTIPGEEDSTVSVGPITIVGDDVAEASIQIE